MPSYVAWTTAALYQLYRHLLPSLTAFAAAVLRAPLIFHRAATVFLLVGTAIQTALLLEHEVADGIGSWINRRIASPSSFASSAARAATPGLLDLLYIAESPASTSGGGGGASSYASTLSALLTVPLTLPVLPPPSRGGGDAPSFSEKEIREWEDASAALRTNLERGMVESAEQWLDVLDHVPLALGPGSESDTLVRRRIEYLEAVRIELDLVAARNPTLQVYALRAADAEEVDTYWAELESKEREREERQQRRMEDKFERWLEEIFSVAEARAKAPDADPAKSGGAGGGGGGGGDGINNDDVAMQMRKRRKDLLDVPLAGIDRPGPTWRDQLRVQWKSMFDPAADGILGHVKREMDNLVARFAVDDDDDDDNDNEAESQPSYDGDGWTPDPLPLMAAHHLRAQLASTIADLRTGGGDGPLAAAPALQEWERATLPPSLDASSWPDEFLSLEQLAIRVDWRARMWALRVLGTVSRRVSSSLPDEWTTAGPLSVRERVNLLRPASTAPFPAFMRTVDATFKAPRDPAHFRVGISQHDLANAIFALPAEDPSRPAMAPRGVMAREQGEGGCSALQREKWRREAGPEGREEVERRLLLRDQQLRRAEGKDSQRASARDEL